MFALSATPVAAFAGAVVVTVGATVSTAPPPIGSLPPQPATKLTSNNAVNHVNGCILFLNLFMVFLLWFAQPSNGAIICPLLAQMSHAASMY